jgi:hypothetical protein
VERGFLSLSVLFGRKPAPDLAGNVFRRFHGRKPLIGQAISWKEVISKGGIGIEG